MAAGLSMVPENIDRLRERLNAVARQCLDRERLQPALAIDAEVALAEISLDRVEELDCLEPIGQGNPAVQLAVRGVTHRQPPQRLGKEQQHLKFWVTDGSATCEALWWDARSALPPADRFDLAIAPEINEYRGQRSIQLRVLDWRPAQ